MIYPEPSSKRERDLPDRAVDRATYPPYRLVWCLEVFSKKTEELVDEFVLEQFDVGALRRLFRRPPSDPMILGGWPVMGRFRRGIEALTGKKLNLKSYSYFVAASALNHGEVNNPNG